VPDNFHVFNVGDSFTIRNEYGIHLHIIVAESSPDDSSTIMLVYLSSAKIPNRDLTTIIQIGEHPFVYKEDPITWVRYQNIIVCQRTDIENNIIEYFGKVNEALLKRIQDGILKSNFVPKGIKQLFNDWYTSKIFRDIHKK
jgi:hypothetical protein